MRPLVVEAYEDVTRPSGGFVVIRMDGLDDTSRTATFSLRPVDLSGGGAGDGQRLKRLTGLKAVATRAAGDRHELIVGPDVVASPLLLAGTPVVIELDGGNLRGQFLWPSVAPPVAPRRRQRMAAARQAMTDGPAGPILPAAPAAPATADAPAEVVDQPPEQHAKDGAGGSSCEGAKAPGGTGSARTVGGTAELVAPDAQSKEAPAASAAVYTIDRRAPPPSRLRAVVRGRWKLAAKIAAAAVAGLLVSRQLGSWLEEAPLPPPSRSLQRSVPAGSPPAEAQLALERAAKADRAAAVEPVLPPAVPRGASPPACGQPELTATVLEGGRVRLRLAAPCLGQVPVLVRAGGPTQELRLDSEGRTEAVLDLVAGPAPLEVRLPDGTMMTRPIATGGLAPYTKVTLLWQAPVDLDLHVLEHAARSGEPGHLWSGAPGTGDEARARTLERRRPYGFISQASAGTEIGDKSEAYTVFHGGADERLPMRFAIDYVTRGDRTAEPWCGSGRLAEIPFEIVISSAVGTVASEAGVIAAVPCGRLLDARSRLSEISLPARSVRK